MRADPTWTEPNEHRLIVPKASGPAGRLLSDLPTRHWGRYELLGLVPHDRPIRRMGAPWGDPVFDSATKPEPFCPVLGHTFVSMVLRESQPDQ